jgi:acetyl esterase
MSQPRHGLPWDTTDDDALQRLARLRTAVAGSIRPTAEAVGESRDIELPHGIRARLYSATDAPTPHRPMIVTFHGGGWVCGDLEMADAFCRRMANLSGCMVLNAEYRLSPEYRYPAALDDCYSTLTWAAQLAPSLGCSTEGVAVAGMSAGANLAAAASLLARDRADNPPILAQILLYPMLDHRMGTDSFLTQPSRELSGPQALRWYWEQYLPQGERPVDAYASPGIALDLSGLPPTYIVTAGLDPLRDEGEIFARRAAIAGVRTVCRRFEALSHGFVARMGSDRIIDDAAAEIVRDVEAVLQGRPVPVGGQGRVVVG